MGPYLSAPITTKNTSTQYNKQMRYFSTEMQGWRKTMQDSKIHKINLQGGISIFGVFDGHGGYQVSKFMERYFLVQIQKNNNFKKGDYEKALIETFRNLDKVLDTNQGNQELKKIRKEVQGDKAETFQGEQIAGGAGCTANVLIVTPTKFYVANAGDSRCVLSRNGIAIPLSQDHKPQNQIQKSRILKSGGSIANGRVNGGLNLSRSLGDFYYKREKGFQIDQQPIISRPDVLVQDRSREQDQFILMGCDGIWQKCQNNNQMMIDRIISERKSGKDPKTVIEGLLDWLLAKQTSQLIGCDNMTAILIQFNRAA